MQRCASLGFLPVREGNRVKLFGHYNDILNTAEFREIDLNSSLDSLELIQPEAEIIVSRIIN